MRLVVILILKPHYSRTKGAGPTRINPARGYNKTTHWSINAPTSGVTSSTLRPAWRSLQQLQDKQPLVHHRSTLNRHPPLDRRGGLCRLSGRITSPPVHPRPSLLLNPRPGLPTRNIAHRASLFLGGVYPDSEMFSASKGAER